jgi:hypothetical protein
LYSKLCITQQIGEYKQQSIMNAQPIEGIQIIPDDNGHTLKLWTVPFSTTIHDSTP